MQSGVDIRIRVGKRIRQLRRNRRLRLVDMVELTGISLGHLSDVENGRSEICLLNLEKLANAFDVHPSDLLK